MHNAFVDVETYGAMITQAISIECGVICNLRSYDFSHVSGYSRFFVNRHRYRMSIRLRRKNVRVHFEASEFLGRLITAPVQMEHLSQAPRQVPQELHKLKDFLFALIAFITYRFPTYELMRKKKDGKIKKSFYLGSREILDRPRLKVYFTAENAIVLCG